MKQALHLIAAAVALSVASVAQADGNPVNVQYTGSLAVVDSPLASGLPVGTAVGISLNFNETFSDGVYNFSDALGPVSGTLTLGGLSYSLNGYMANTIWGPDSTSVTDVQVQFTGTGPTVSGFDFYGVFIKFSTGLEVENVYVGYEFDAQTSSAFYYGDAEGRGTVTRLGSPNEVPLPNTLTLVMLGLAALGVQGRRRRGA